jgi:hypothetical protein
MQLRYFKDEELACKCCGKLKLDFHFADKLDLARQNANVPFVVTSGYRCPTYNISVGGKKDSSHIHGKAADILTPTSFHRFWIMYGLIKAGFDRIGVGKDFIHADMDDTKAEGVLWHYYE